MYSVTVNGNNTYKTDLEVMGENFSGTLNGDSVKGNFIRVNDFQFHMLFNNRSYNVDVLKMNREEKTLVVKINSVKFSLQLKDKYDELLHTLGLDNLATKKVNDIKAPMPGMVLKILVSEGDQVKKGDALIVLEAMKMENILKSPTEGVIKRIAAVQGTAVEKNQFLIQF